MKRITYLSLILLFSTHVFSQKQNHGHDFEKMVEAEMKSASKKKILTLNSNTLNYNITYTKLEFTINPDIRAISGKVTTTFKAISDMTNITFDFYKTSSNPFTISSVMINGSNASFIHNANHELIITLPSTLTTGNSSTVEITYSGTPSTGHPSSNENAFFKSTHGVTSTPIIYTLSEPYGAADWWPCKQDLNDKIDNGIDIYITTPSQYLSSSNGVEMSRTITGLNATTHYKHSYPIPAYLIAFAVTNYTKKNTGIAGIFTTFPIIDYIYPEIDNAGTTSTLAQTIPVINFLESKIGPYPYNTEKYGHTQWDWGGGMEHATNSFMVNFNRELVSHEMAHQWFGDKITCGSWKDIWLNEGLTEYMSGCVKEEFDGATSFVSWKNTKITNITSSPTGNLYLYDSQLSSVGRIFSGRLTYNKGAMVTNMLRYIMGDVNFFQALRNYLSDPTLAYAYAATPQFQAHLEAVHGASLQEFFDDWVYKEGYPIYNINAYNSAVNQATVVINQTQSITNSAQTGYVSFYEMPVPVRLVLSNGSNLDVKLINTFSGQSFNVTLPAGTTITDVIFDPNKDIISNNSTATLNTDSFNLETIINVFPNPASDILTIEIPSSIILQKVSLYNAIGQKTLESNNSKINLSSLSKGIYAIILETNVGTFHKKLIKN